jgi:hypothetical protein
MTRPSPELDGRDDITPIAKCKNKIGTFANYFSENQKWDAAQDTPELAIVDNCERDRRCGRIGRGSLRAAQFGTAVRPGFGAPALTDPRSRLKAARSALSSVSSGGT